MDKLDKIEEGSFWKIENGVICIIGHEGNGSYRAARASSCGHLIAGISLPKTSFVEQIPREEAINAAMGFMETRFGNFFTGVATTEDSLIGQSWLTEMNSLVFILSKDAREKLVANRLKEDGRFLAHIAISEKSLSEKLSSEAALEIAKKRFQPRIEGLFSF